MNSKVGNYINFYFSSSCLNAFIFDAGDAVRKDNGSIRTV